MSTSPTTPPPALHDLLERLHRVEGQVRGIGHMVERGAPSVDVLVQVASARAALAAVGMKIVECQVRDAIPADDDRGELLAADTLVAVHRLLGFDGQGLPGARRPERRRSVAATDAPSA